MSGSEHTMFWASETPIKPQIKPYSNAKTKQDKTPSNKQTKTLHHKTNIFKINILKNFLLYTFKILSYGMGVHGGRGFLKLV